MKMGPSGQAPTFHTYEIPQIPFHTHAGRSKVFKNWYGSDGRVVPQPTNPSKFRRDFASGKSHSAPLPPPPSPPFHSYSASQSTPMHSFHSILTPAFFSFIHSLVDPVHSGSALSSWKIQSKYGISFESERALLTIL